MTIVNILIVVTVCLVLLFGAIFMVGLIANVAISLWKLCRLLLTFASSAV